MSLIGGILLVRAEPVVVVAHAAAINAAVTDPSERTILDLLLIRDTAFMTDSSNESNPKLLGVGVGKCYCVSMPSVTEMSSFSMRAISVV
jgi:hypothetical protein